ncbi:MAG: CoA pyrophosphatase [Motiliproteus sp.]
MTPEWLASRFNDPTYKPVKYSQQSDYQQFRGDHNLNAGMEPTRNVDGLLNVAAVLIPIVKRGSALSVLLTQRTSHLSHHPGQISFPGGRTEPEDTSSEHTALRETEEEVGLPAQYIEVVGELDDYLTRTGFIVTPIVGLVSSPFPVSPDPFEVEEVFEVPLDFLLDTNNHHSHSQLLDGKLRHFYAIPYNRHFIWGATAGMLVNLFQLLTDSSAGSLGKKITLEEG